MDLKKRNFVPNLAPLAVLAFSCTGGTIIENPLDPFNRKISCSENITQKSCSAEIPGELQYQAQSSAANNSEFLKNVNIYYSLNGIDGTSRSYSLEFIQGEKDCPKLPKLKAVMNHLKSSMDLYYYKYDSAVDCVLRSRSAVIYQKSAIATTGLSASKSVEIKLNALALQSESNGEILMDVNMKYDLGKAVVRSIELYPDDYKVYILGMESAVLVPSDDERIQSWEIEPQPPKGLNFDQKTGVLSGIAAELKNETLYTITAKTEYYNKSFALYLRVLDPSEVLIVNSPEDPPDFANDCKPPGTRCSLRGGIEWLKNNPSLKNYLYIPAPLEVTLSGKSVSLTADYKIIGGQASLSVVNAASKSQVFYLGDPNNQDPVLDSFYFLNLTLKNGFTLTDRGGAIAQFYESSSLVVDRVKFENNRARQGGAINMDGGMTARISNSIFLNNSAIKGSNQEPAGGGAIRLYTTLGGDIENCIFRNNLTRGGSASAVYTGDGNNNIRNSIFYENQAVLEPESNEPGIANGTIVVDYHGVTTLYNTVVYRNESQGLWSAGGIHSYSESGYRIISSIIAENSGPEGNCNGESTNEFLSLGDNLVYPPEPDCGFNHPTDRSSAVPNLLSYFGIGI